MAGSNVLFARLVGTKSLSLSLNTLLTSSSPSFLEDMERIATRDYQATDDDIMRASLKRSGVKEYRMVFENGESSLSYSLNSSEKLYHR